MKHLLWIEQSKPGVEVQQCIKAEGYVLQHAADLTSLLNSCSAQQPDIVALATELPEISMPDLMLLLKKRYPSCQVIVLVDKTQHQLGTKPELRCYRLPAKTI